MPIIYTFFVSYEISEKVLFPIKKRPMPISFFSCDRFSMLEFLHIYRETAMAWSVSNLVSWNISPRQYRRVCGSAPRFALAANRTAAHFSSKRYLNILCLLLPLVRLQIFSSPNWITMPVENFIAVFNRKIIFLGGIPNFPSRTLPWDIALLFLKLYHSAPWTKLRVRRCRFAPSFLDRWHVPEGRENGARRVLGAWV